jgi:hypothetical protein
LEFEGDNPVIIAKVPIKEWFRWLKWQTVTLLEL